MKTSLAILAAALCLCNGCGCGSRSLPADGDAGVDGPLGDGGHPGDGGQHADASRDGAPPSCAAQDAVPSGAKCDLLLGYAWDGVDCQEIQCECLGADCGALYQTYETCLDDHAGCVPEESCARQQINGCADPCMSVAGVWWNGTFCQPIICCCEGPDCAATWDTWQECLAVHTTCALNECAATGGYCDYGDAVIPTCLDGYGKDFSITAGICGLGVCCAPCPVAGDGVNYVSHDPSECARIDYTCATGWVGFDNECGCGCIRQ